MLFRPSNEDIERCVRVAWCGEWLLHSERLQPALDLLTTEPERAMNLETGNPSVRRPRVDRRGFDVQPVCEVFHSPQHAGLWVWLVHAARISTVGSDWGI